MINGGTLVQFTILSCHHMVLNDKNFPNVLGTHSTHYLSNPWQYGQVTPHWGNTLRLDATRTISLATLHGPWSIPLTYQYS